MKRKKIVAIIIVVALVAAGALAWRHFSKDETTQQANLTDSNGINYNPPTDEEQQAGDSQKDQTIKDEDTRNNSSGQNQQTARVIITDAGQYDNTIEVRAFIPNHYQDGTCTITLTKGNSKVEKSTPAYRDASTTICTNPLFARSEFPSSGEWRVAVTYQTSTVKATSESKVIEVK